jgi:hypothetical protein
MGNLNERLDKIEDLLREKPKKKKKFKIPWTKRVSPAKAKKGYVTCFKVNENSQVKVTKELIDKQTMVIDGVPRLATPKHILYMGKNPLVILPSYSTNPLTGEELQKGFDINEHHEKTLDDGSHIKGYKLLMDKMKSEVTNPKKKVGGWVMWIFLLIIGVIIAYAFITGG